MDVCGCMYVNAVRMCVGVCGCDIRLGSFVPVVSQRKLETAFYLLPLHTSTLKSFHTVHTYSHAHTHPHIHTHPHCIHAHACTYIHIHTAFTIVRRDFPFQRWRSSCQKLVLIQFWREKLRICLCVCGCGRMRVCECSVNACVCECDYNVGV